jgi:rhodanese-related sulfurtransferase
MATFKAPEARELTPHQAQKWLAEGGPIQLVDVRTVEEHREAHLSKDKLIPLNTLEARLHELDKKTPVLLYCASGGRSGQALRYLESQGYQVKHVQGGIMQWAGDGLPYEGR